MHFVKSNKIQANVIFIIFIIMSTEIYNAYKIEKTITEILPILIKVAPEIKEVCKIEYLEDIYEMATFQFDKEKEKSFDELKEYFFDDEYSKDNHNNGLLAMLFPYENSTYIMFFGNTKHIKIIEKYIDLIDFHYQNSTDKPDEITENDWNNRINIWDKILGGDGWGKPIDYGFQFTLSEKMPCSYYDLLTMKKIKIPSNEKRAGRLVLWKNRNLINKDKIYSSVSDFQKTELYKELVKIQITKLKAIS